MKDSRAPEANRFSLSLRLLTFDWNGRKAKLVVDMFSAFLVLQSCFLTSDTCLPFYARFSLQLPQHWLNYHAGLIWSEVKQLWDVGLQEYVHDMWNVIDFITNSLYVATVALRVVSYFQVSNDNWVSVPIDFQSSSSFFVSIALVE